MIRLVTFDLDDTLWDVGPALRRAESAQWDWLEAYYGPLVDRHDTQKQRQLKRETLEQEPELVHRISRFRQRFIERYLAASGVPPQEARSGAHRAFTAFMTERHHVEVFPEAAPMLEALSGRYLLGALTNGNADVRRTPLGDYFQFVFRAEEVGASKPAPELFQAAASAARVEANEIVHVGDHAEHDVSGAKAFGAKAVWFNRTGETLEMADLTIRCLSDLPDALQRLDS